MEAVGSVDENECEGARAGAGPATPFLRPSPLVWHGQQKMPPPPLPAARGEGWLGHGSSGLHAFCSWARERVSARFELCPISAAAAVPACPLDTHANASGPGRPLAAVEEDRHTHTSLTPPCQPTGVHSIPFPNPSFEQNPT